MCQLALKHNCLKSTSRCKAVARAANSGFYCRALLLHGLLGHGEGLRRRRELWTKHPPPQPRLGWKAAPEGQASGARGPAGHVTLRVSHTNTAGSFPSPSMQGNGNFRHQQHLLATSLSVVFLCHSPDKRTHCVNVTSIHESHLHMKTATFQERAA